MNGNEDRKRSAEMGLGVKIGIVAALIVIVAAALFAKNNRTETKAEAASPVAAATPDAKQPPAQAETPKAALPRLVDLGAGKCIPCKMMAPILEDLKKEYAGRMEVVFIDVWENPDAGKQYGIKIIPTQIFYDAAGKELFRHEGFFSKEDILGKWKELGVNIAEVKH